MTAICGLCMIYAGLDRYLFASRAIKINTCLLLLFFRQLDKTCQPVDEAGKDLVGSLKSSSEPAACRILVHERNCPFLTSHVYGLIWRSLVVV